MHPEARQPTDVGAGRPLRVLIVGHEATRTGAALQLLHILSAWAERDDVELRLVLRRGGELASAFRALAPTVVLTPDWVVAARVAIRRTGQRLAPLRSAPRAAPATALGSGGTPRTRPRALAVGHVVRVLNGRLFELPRARLRRLAASAAADVVLVNTGTLGDLLPAMGTAPLVSYVHEQDAMLTRTTFRRDVARVVQRSDAIVASSGAVRDELISCRAADPSRVVVLRPFAPPHRPVVRAAARRGALSGLGWSDGVTLVGACGGLNWSKDPDAFVDLAARVLATSPVTPCRFLWLGGEVRDVERTRLQKVVGERGLSDHVRFLPPRDDPASFFAALDVFVVVSRSESFGVVALEAAREGVPIVCFEAVGGLAEFVRDDAGFVVPGRDHEVLAQRVLLLAADASLRAALGATAAARVQREHSVTAVAEGLLDVLRLVAPAASPPAES